MKYAMSLLPLAGLAIAAPGNWQDDPVKETTTTPAAASSTWEDANVDPTTSASWEDNDVTVTETATGTYCDKTGKLTKPAPAGGECTIDVTTVTVATATVTVPAGGKGGNGGHGGNGGAVTVTETETKTVGGKDTVTETVTKTVGGKETVTVTEGGKDAVTKTVTEECSEPTGKPGHGGPGGPGGPGDKCLTDDGAEELVKNFINLLEHTSYPGGPKGAPGSGYNMNVSDATLSKDFVDISDSINFMAGLPLGSVTFPNKAAFDAGQGVEQPEVDVDTLNIFHDCSSITWRWKITPRIPNAFPVNGINYMIVNDEGLISKNYAEFNDGAWLQSFGQTCALAPVTVKPGDAATKF